MCPVQLAGCKVQLFFVLLRKYPVYSPSTNKRLASLSSRGPLGYRVGCATIVAGFGNQFAILFPGCRLFKGGCQPLPSFRRATGLLETIVGAKFGVFVGRKFRHVPGLMPLNPVVCGGSTETGKKLVGYPQNLVDAKRKGKSLVQCRTLNVHMHSVHLRRHS